MNMTDAFVSDVYDVHVLSYMAECLKNVPQWKGVYDSLEVVTQRVGRIVVDISFACVVNEIAHFWNQLPSKECQKILDSVKDNRVKNILMDMHPICDMMVRPSARATHLEGIDTFHFTNVRKVFGISEFIDNTIFILSMTKWKENYGGEKWKNIATQTGSLDQYMKIGMTNNAVVMINLLLSAEHNTGSLFAKAKNFDQKKLKAALDEIHAKKDPMDLIGKTRLAARKEHAIELVHSMVHGEKRMNTDDFDTINQLIEKAIKSSETRIIGSIPKVEIPPSKDYTDHFEDMKRDVREQIKEMRSDAFDMLGAMADAHVRMISEIKVILEDSKETAESRLSSVENAFSRMQNEHQAVLEMARHVLEWINEEREDAIQEEKFKIFDELSKEIWMGRKEKEYRAAPWWKKLWWGFSCTGPMHDPVFWE